MLYYIDNSEFLQENPNCPQSSLIGFGVLYIVANPGFRVVR